VIRDTKFKMLLAGLLGVFSLTSFATTLDYAVIIDAGSSGSRVHLVAYADEGSLTPRIYPTTWSMKVNPGLSTFKDKTADIANYIGQLVDYAQKHLAEANYQGTPKFYLLGTAGMRLLTENEQNSIYSQVKAYISNNTHFDIKQIETISGDYEGVYGWLSVNALNGNLYNPNKTTGILEMGGASIQITFALDNLSKYTGNKHLIKVKVDQQTFALYSRSDLGLGINEAINTINSLACYPSGYTTASFGIGNWNGNECKTNIDAILSKVHLTDDLPEIPKDMPFIAFDEYYKTFSFFEGLNNTSIKILENNVEKICTHTWDELKNAFPNFPPQDLSKICFSGSYVAEILGPSNGYAFLDNDPRIRTSSTIEGTDISWAYGALIYQLNKQ
jgi:apyrase